MNEVLQQILNGIVVGSLYVLTATGLAIVYGVLRIIHVAHAAIYVLGAYCAVLIFGALPHFPLALVGSMVVCAVFGVVFYMVVYRPIIEAQPLVILIASVACFILLEDAFRLVMGPYIRALPVGAATRPIAVGLASLSELQVWIVLITGGLLISLWFLMYRTPLGLAWRAVAQNREVAGAFGINPERIVPYCFLVGSGMAGAAGALVGALYNQVFPSMGAIPAYKALAVIVLGGLGNVWGTVVGGVLLGVAETLVTHLFGGVLPRDAIAFLVLVLVLVIRPYGLLGRK